MLYNFQFHDVFERRTSTGSELSALLGLDFEQMFGEIVSVRVKTLSNTNLVASRHMKREKSSLPVEVRRWLNSPLLFEAASSLRASLF